MSETSGTETIAPQRIAQARRRLAPLSFRRFIPSEGNPDAPTGLSPTEVQSKCFAVLGYLEEYSRTPDHSVPEIKLEESEGLQSLEKKLDNILHPNNLKPQDSQHDETMTSSEAEALEIKKHQALIRQKLSDLLVIPEVRERFKSEFNQELPHYQAARHTMRKVRDIDRVTEKLRLAIYRKYLDSKQQHGKLTQSAADQIGGFQEILNGLELEKRGIEDTASPSTAGYLETQKLLDYKKQLKENGFVMTPSREYLIDRITREALAGKKIFLVGSTGTGKTQLAFYALNSLTGGYEIVPWHEGTTPRDIFGYRELFEDETGKVQSGTKPGPYPRALEKQVGLVHEEFTGGSTRTQLSMKYLMGAKPGERVQIPGFNGEVYEITPNFIELFTGNPKDKKTKQREDMDPAILRELTGIEVSYMPASEMHDIIRAMLMEENGVLKLSKSEVDYVERLSKAAEMMQKIHNGDFEDFSQEMKNLLGIDDRGNTETTLNTNFLDPGTLFKLFGEWELAQARGQKFADYMGSKLGEFIKDPKTLSIPEERKTLQKVLHVFRLITDATGSDVRVTIEDQEKGYILPSEMAGQARLSSEDPMAIVEVEGEVRERIVKREKAAWGKVLGIPETQVVLPELSADITAEMLLKFENDPEHVGIRAFPKLEIGTLNDLKTLGVDAFLARIQLRYPGLHVYEPLSEGEKQDHTVGRLPKKWYWEQVKDGKKVSFPEGYSKGNWLAVEVMPKPAYGSSYNKTMISDELGHTERFNVTWNTAHQDISGHKSAILLKLGLPANREVRMPKVEELNMLANREGLGATDTYEWAEDEYRESGDSDRLIVGYSGVGGAANVSWSHPGVSDVRIGFRAAVVLGS